jgi:hypothetical protein
MNFSFVEMICQFNGAWRAQQLTEPPVIWIWTVMWEVKNTRTPDDPACVQRGMFCFGLVWLLGPLPGFRGIDFAQ